ncbi:MAG: threonylcarbamoyl-AMP synthase [Lachnospiraceae bacterium]|nr:threonylcarbamoyl-AMP synthase [Lachnospiraceae bacterium]
MKTIIDKVNKDDCDVNIIDKAGKILKSGGLVAFPTETVYGLGGDALNKEASGKIYAAKGRPSDNPLIVHIADKEALYELASYVPESAIKLADKFWPGPLTMVLNKSAVVPKETTGGLDTVAIRFPNHPVAIELIKRSKVYIAAPSANTSGRPSPTLAKHVEDDLSGRIDMIIDGGEVGIGIESTIVDLTSEVPVILRPGYITKKMLEEVVGKVEIDKAILECNKDKNYKPKAPGMKYKHYAPKAELYIVEGSQEEVVKTINKMTLENESKGIKTGIISTSQTKDSYVSGIIKCIGSRDDDVSISQGLYKVLREFDECDVDIIYTESFMDDDFGQAIMNRLLKAAGYKIINGGIL